MIAGVAVLVALAIAGTAPTKLVAVALHAGQQQTLSDSKAVYNRLIVCN